MPPIQQVVVACLCLALTFPVQPADPYPETTVNPYASLEGQLCSPPQKQTCGPVQELEVLAEPAPRTQFGPNTCLVVRTVLARELEYRYQRFCTYPYYYEQQCTVQCLPANTCEEAVEQVITEEHTSCCDGFTTRPWDDRDYVIYYYYWDVLEPPGCPVAYGPTLLQCMSIQGLDTFLSLYRTAKPVCPLLRLLKIDGAPYTVFAPNDSAFEAISDQLETLTPADVCRLLLRHIVSGSLDSSQLLNGMRLTSFAGTRLFVAAVQHYIPVDENREIVENVWFINGAQVYLRDACDASVGGSLHIIEQVLLPTTLTTTRILQNDPRLSAFLDAMERVPFLLQLISSTITPYTIFAPTNEAFNRSTYSFELLECLVSEDGLPLDLLLRYHMIRGAEYKASLSLQRYGVLTFSGQPLLLATTGNGTLLLGEDRVEVVEPDIPATNGVVHVIDEVLAPPELEFGDCEIFAPTEPPPPTQPPPTAEPSGSGSGDTIGIMAPLQDSEVY